MNKEQTTKFIGLIALHFTALQPTQELIDAWHLVLEDYTPQECWEAYKVYLGEKHEFAPNPSQIIGAIKKSKESNSGALAWSGMGGDSDLSDEAWRLWGGQTRYSMLPDLKYSDNPSRDSQVIAFARKEFIEIYEDLADEKKHNAILTNKKALRNEKTLLGQVMTALEKKNAV